MCAFFSYIIVVFGRSRAQWTDIFHPLEFGTETRATNYIPLGNSTICAMSSLGLSRQTCLYILPFSSFANRFELYRFLLGFDVSAIHICKSNQFDKPINKIVRTKHAIYPQHTSRRRGCIWPTRFHCLRTNWMPIYGKLVRAYRINIRSRNMFNAKIVIF